MLNIIDKIFRINFSEKPFSKKEIKEIEFLKSVNLPNIENVCVWDVVWRLYVNYRMNDKLRRLYSLLYLYTHMQYKKIIIDSDDTVSDVVLFLVGLRDDHKYVLNHIRYIIEGVVVSDSKENVRIKNRDYDLLKKWERCLKKEIHGALKRKTIINYIYILYNQYMEIDSIMSRNYKYLIMSSEPTCENFFYLQMMRSRSNFLSVGITYINVMQKYADYFKRMKFDWYVVNGLFAEERFIEAGIDKTRIRRAGYPSRIGVNVENNNNIQESAIVLFVDGYRRKYNKTYDNEICILNRFCNEYGFKLIIKLHPTKSADKYRREYLEGVYVEKVSVYGSDIMAEELMDKNDIIIASQSSVLEVAYCMNKNVFQYYSADDFDENDIMISAYNEVDLFRFSSYEELVALYNSIGTSDYNKKKKLICSKFNEEGNTANNYKLFFEEIGIDIR